MFIYFHYFLFYIFYFISFIIIFIIIIFFSNFIFYFLLYNLFHLLFYFPNIIYFRPSSFNFYSLFFLLRPPYPVLPPPSFVPKFRPRFSILFSIIYFPSRIYPSPTIFHPLFFILYFLYTREYPVQKRNKMEANSRSTKLRENLAYNKYIKCHHISK
jgi:hypothetical protein